MRTESPPPVETSLADAPWLRQPETRAVLNALAATGHESRIVGGTVRNALLGERVTDIDIATTGTPEQVIAAARAAGLIAIPTGIAHGTVTVVADRVPFEVTTLREDVETFGRHARVAFTADWAADARRRDFTINALYCDAEGVVSDPLGGLDDLAARRVRFIGDAHERIREDALRILRFFRFHARYGGRSPDTAGLEACAKERALLTTLSAERVRAELLKLLEAPGAADAVTTMRDYGFLAALLGRAPRPAVLRRLIEDDTAHYRDADPLLRLSVLAVAVDEDRDYLAARLRLSNAERDELVSVDPLMMHLIERDTPGQHRSLYKIGAAQWRKIAMAGAAAAGSDEDRTAWQTLGRLPDRWQIPRFPLRGSDVLALGLAPGPKVGALLAEIEAEWVAEDFVAGSDELKTRLAARVRRRGDSR